MTYCLVLLCHKFLLRYTLINRNTQKIISFQKRILFTALKQLQNTEPIQEPGQTVSQGHMVIAKFPAKFYV